MHCQTLSQILNFLLEHQIKLVLIAVIIADNFEKTLNFTYSDILLSTYCYHAFRQALAKFIKCVIS